MLVTMGEKHSGYSLKAPGRSGLAVHLPGRGSFPAIDDHLVKPEVTRDEIIGGRKVIALPALPAHGNQHSDLDYVLKAHVGPGYRSSVDLLTRFDVDSDFASDVCVYRTGVDPETGGRFLEEIAFEVVSEQNERVVSEKAPRMLRRGVRRVFAIFVKGQRRVCEWSTASGGWQTLDPASSIEDPCLAVPLPVSVLLDAAEADNAVVEALAAKGNPAIRRREAAARSEGKAEGKIEGKAEAKTEERAESVLKVLAARHVIVTEAQRMEVLSCRDLGRLDRWLQKAVLAASAHEVLAEP